MISYFKAGYSILYLHTFEEARAEDDILGVVNSLSESNGIKYDIKIWSVTDGLAPISKDGKIIKPQDSKATSDPVKALEAIKSAAELVKASISNKQQATAGVFVFRNLHLFMNNAVVLQHLRDIARLFKSCNQMLIIISPVNKIPPELQREVVLIEYDLPNKTQIAKIWDMLWSKYSSRVSQFGVVVDQDERERIIQSAMGLTTVEAENALAKGVIDACNGTEKSIAKLVLTEKALTVKKSGILEYFEDKVNPDDIGGLDNLKNWLLKRKMAFSKKAIEFGLPKPKGIMLVGSPGCGKSLVAKASSGVLSLPLIRFDISKIFGGIVGQSEEQCRNALATIDAVGDCVVWIDEAEKAFAGASGSGSNDSGVTRRVFGLFLTWMQEKKSNSFVVMTLNGLDGIPPEMLRKGRFDENFFVDLPSVDERRAIFEIHVKKRGRSPEKIFKNKAVFNDMLNKSAGFSGAEIEYAVTEGMYTAFSQDRDLICDDIAVAIPRITPLSKSCADALDKMTAWAKLNATFANVRVDNGASVAPSRELNI